MIELTTKTKAWGNSVGILLPKKAGIKPDQKVTVHIEPVKCFTKVKDIFGSFRIKKNIEILSQEINEELDVDA